jgi:DNA-3-methyladenine glycosylase I
MSSDVIIGRDGKPRCAWAGAGDTALGRYHDEVWGTRTYDESAMFEALTLGVFEVGLSWSIVFGKRDAFRKHSRAACRPSPSLPGRRDRPLCVTATQPVRRDPCSKCSTGAG